MLLIQPGKGSRAVEITIKQQSCVGMAQFLYKIPSSHGDDHKDYLLVGYDIM